MITFVSHHQSEDEARSARTNAQSWRQCLKVYMYTLTIFTRVIDLRPNPRDRKRQSCTRVRLTLGRVRSGQKIYKYWVGSMQF